MALFTVVDVPYFELYTTFCVWQGFHSWIPGSCCHFWVPPGAYEAIAYVGGVHGAYAVFTVGCPGGCVVLPARFVGPLGFWTLLVLASS
jgi:hypothetical protein